MPNLHLGAVVKIAIKVDNESHLFQIRKTETLEQIIEDVCKRYNKPSHSWGLKLNLELEDGKKVKRYVTETNLKEIVDGALVELVPSLQFMLEWIFNENTDGDIDKFKHFMDLCNDPSAIDEIKRCKYHDLVPDFSMKLDTDNTQRCLIGLSRILIHGVVPTFKPLFIEFLTKIVIANNRSIAITEISLKLLSQIINIESNLCELVNERLTIDDVIPYIWRDENIPIQLNTLNLINNLAKNCKDNREKIIDDMKSTKNKMQIFKCVIENGNSKISLALSHALYIYQTYILSPYYAFQTNQVNFNDDHEDILEEDIGSLTRRATIIDFEEKEIRSRKNTNTSRLSTMSRISSNISISTQNDEVFLRNKHKSTPSLYSAVNVTKLTLLCIEYYKNKYTKNFTMSVLEAQYHPGFNKICDQITEILCDILHIGKEPDANYSLLVPLVFIYKENKPFFEELFCRAIWLIARTRREMKAKVDEDHAKVLAVLKEQLIFALKSQPILFSDLTNKLKEITHLEIFENWEEERNKQWIRSLKFAPSIKELKLKLLPGAEELVREQRLLVLEKGECFPKLPEKRGKQHYWFIHLNRNTRKLFYGDFDPDTKKYTSKKVEITIDNIKYIVSGRASRHVKDNRIKRSDLIPRCFSLLFNDDLSLDFLARDVVTAQYWVDGFHILLSNDKPVESPCYQSELETLVTMELNLELLELQNIHIPFKAPLIPPLPLDCREKPMVPTKTETLVRRSKARRLQFSSNETLNT